MLKNKNIQKSNKRFALKINKISKTFEEKVVLDNVSFSLYFGQKVALIGPNGSGKSTLAKIIMTNLKQDSGDIEVFKNFQISYLPQEMNEDVLVEEYLEKKSEVFEFIKKFNFDEEIFQRKISSLSGGEKTKVFLTRISTEKSPIIILDEPTNNLDQEGLEILENIIKNSKSAFLIISHDRAFLDETVSKVIFLDENTHNIKSYDGNYSAFIEKRKEEDQRQNTLFGENQRKKKKMENEVMVHRANSFMKEAGVRPNNDNDKLGNNLKKSNFAKKASGALKKAKSKLSRFEDKEKTITKRPLKIDFSEMKNSGNKVLEIKDLLLPFGLKAQSGEKISLEVFAGDRLRIVGKNGAGKTTFINQILKSFKDKRSESKTKNTAGEINWGTNIELGYLPQTLAYGKENQNFLDYFIEKSQKDISDARKILSRFGFADAEVEATILELSPGMRSRGKIALMLARNPNVLILDEPTNNLDLEVLEKLEKALESYKGTIIFVSHDKYFIEKIKENKKLVL